MNRRKGKTTGRRRATVAVLGPLVGLLLAWGLPAGAQPVPAGDRVLEEIVVVARKKEESLQQIPVAVAAVSGEHIDTFDLDNLQEMSTRIPGLKMHAGGSGQGGAVWFRGIGSQPAAGAFESSLAFNLDGAVVTTPRIVQNSFFDVAAVELLKGPQPTYFGKAATAGVLSLRTQNPTDEAEAYLKAAYESEQDSTIAEGVLSGPLTDTLRARLAFRTRQTDEMVRNIAPAVANPFRAEDSTDVRLTLDWLPTDALSFNLKISDHDYENEGALQYTRVLQQGTLLDNPFVIPGVPEGATGIPDLTNLAGGNSSYFRDGVPYSENDTTMIVLNAGYALNNSHRLALTLADVKIDDEGLDNYGLDFVGRTSASANAFDIRTLELRLEGELKDRARYLLGAYTEDHEQLFDAEQFIGLGSFVGGGLFGVVPTTPGFAGALHDVQKIHDTDSDIDSLFGSFAYDLTDRLTLDLGVRYTDVSREGTITVPYVHDFVIDLGTNPAYAAAVAGLLAGDPALGPVIQFLFGGAANTRDNGTFVSTPILVDDSDTNIEASLNFAINEQQSLYLAYKEAFKPGGIDNSIVAWNSDIPTGAANNWANVIFDAETADGFEVGYKSQLLDNRLRLNAVLYLYDYDNFQVQNFNAGAFSFVTDNAGRVDSEGLEVDFAYLPTSVEGLTLSGSLAWDQSEFDQFTNAETGVVLDGRRLGQSPEWSGTFGAEYFQPLAGSGWDLTLSYLLSYSGDYFVENSRLIDYQQDAFTTH
ncbi:MAG: TonB-dependent receptor, partial [Pseudomonadota bacterium]